MHKNNQLECKTSILEDPLQKTLKQTKSLKQTKPFQAPHMDLQKPPDDYFTQYDAASSPYQVEWGLIRVDAGTPVESPIIDTKVILSASRSHSCLDSPKFETC